MFRIEPAEVRKRRQEENVEKATASNFDKKYINTQAMDRLVEGGGFTKKEDFLREIENNPGVWVKKILGECVAIRASRQGTKDEQYVIQGLSKELVKYGVKIERCGVNDLIPIRNKPLVLSRKEAKRRCFDKASMLKSFDFTGEITKKNQNIYGFAKICLGVGGHQDNVFNETRDVIEWADKYGDQDSIYVFVIDTDNPQRFQAFEELGKDRRDNIWVCNHITFQQRVAKIQKVN